MKVEIPAGILQKVDATIKNGILSKKPYILVDSTDLNSNEKIRKE